MNPTTLQARKQDQKPTGIVAQPIFQDNDAPSFARRGEYHARSAKQLAALRSESHSWFRLRLVSETRAGRSAFRRGSLQKQKCLCDGQRSSRALAQATYSRPFPLPCRSRYLHLGSRRKLLS